MTRSGFLKTPGLAHFKNTVINDLKNFRKQPIAFLRLSVTGAALFCTCWSLNQAMFIKSEYTAETDEAKARRHFQERRLRQRDSRLASDGERDLFEWQEKNSERINRVLNS